jgi:hypothetical protein
MSVTDSTRRALLLPLLVLGVSACTSDERASQTGAPVAMPAGGAVLPCAAIDTGAVVRIASGGCLVATRRHTAGPGKPLVAFLHGDSGGVIGQGAWARDGERVATWGMAAGATAVQLVV